ncbi:ribonuclease H-like domain-containing protein [Dichotomopilus funicola]|uniref:Ribonuclease H-like domain-containing protein n=1 Tax=Dichotomopilus funicola TaxID=1934379 RepID=A0AAN6UW76_9PEZI|nr:ribonuclease H-like domain-containing protein [Dichotomopilus funicola]
MLNAGIAAIMLDSGTLQQLGSLVHPTEELKEAGYVVTKLTQDELEQKKRCATCGVRIGKVRRMRDRQNRARQQQPQLANALPPRSEDSSASASGNATHPNDDNNARRNSVMRCHFHPGRVQLKAWTCCGKHLAEAPCTSKEDHDPPEEQDRTIQQRWQFHHTTLATRSSHRLAVAIDCEMGTAFDGDSELIRLTLIDYFSGETLIDSLVYPDVEMQHFNTRWSGITRREMEKSRRQRQCIMGRNAARARVFRYVGSSTIVVGHSAQNDLSSLRWIHHRIVDSYMEGGQPKEEDKPKEGGPVNHQKRSKHHPDGMSLKALAMRRLGRAIQMGNKGHDSLEDALAARDLIHAHIASLAQ